VQGKQRGVEEETRVQMVISYSWLLSEAANSSCYVASNDMISERRIEKDMEGSHYGII
jgi:hypothetical protein